MKKLDIQKFRSESFNLISSFNRKLPEVSDIFNKSLTNMQEQFKVLVYNEIQQLVKFMSEEQTLRVINETYSYILLKTNQNKKGEMNISEA